MYYRYTDCLHIKSSGARCGAPAMRQSTLCYFHSDLNRRHEVLKPNALTELHVPKALIDQYGQFKDILTAEYFSGHTEPFTLTFPPLEDHESIQIALSVILTALASNRIDPKRATVLLYGLQVASANTTRLKPTNPAHMVVDVTEQPDGTLLANPDPELLAPPLSQ
jgi:hypothetical protein